MTTIQKTSFGSVKPYTRHKEDCPHADDKDFNSCNCPKWLYVRTSHGKRERYSLKTPSWAEANRFAAEKLHVMDPEIAAARAAKEQTKSELVTIGDAWQMWLDRTERKFGKWGVYPQYKTLGNVLKRWASSQGIEYIQEIQPIQLEQWYSSHEWTRLVSRSQRWGILRSAFAYWTMLKVIKENPILAIKADPPSKDHVQGPYTEEQVTALMASIKDTIPGQIDVREKRVYVERLTAYLTLLLNVGCDLVDAVLHEPERITEEKVGDRVIPVYRYARKKTGVDAVIPLHEDVAALIRSVPVSPQCDATMPFRSRATENPDHDVHLWSRRIQRVLKAAGVTEVVLPGRDKRGKQRTKKANAKMLRHTFAVRQLQNGQRPEEVARMLGHVDATMVRLHYAPWVKELQDAHIQRVIGSW
jgi:integrase